jgi:hypothetical protein
MRLLSIQAQIYPILLLVFMLRSDVAAAFQPAPGAPSTPER